MSSQSSKKSSHKKSGKKTPMDSEVTRIVLIFLLLLVIIVLLVAAFMSLGHGESSVSPQQGHVLNIEAPADTQNAETAAPPVETVDPNHGNTETETIPAEVLNPELATTGAFSYMPSTELNVQTAPAVPETNVPYTMPVDAGMSSGAQGVATQAPVIAYTTTGTRPASPNPVYVSSDPYAGIATLAPPLTTAGNGSPTGNNNGSTVTTTVAQATPGEYSDTNYVTPISGSASIYSAPGGSANGTIGTSGSFTIVQEMVDSNGTKWGKLKSGAGWVILS